MIDEAAITAACKVVEAENKINVAKAAVEELEKTTKLADETELMLELAKEMHKQCKYRDLLHFFFIHMRREASYKKFDLLFCRLSWRGCGLGLSLWGLYRRAQQCATFIL